jgi:hypothetical protein
VRAATSPGGTKIPAFPSATNWGTTPTKVLTTALPEAIASIMDNGLPSKPEEESAKTSMAERNRNVAAQAQKPHLAFLGAKPPPTLQCAAATQSHAAPDFVTFPSMRSGDERGRKWTEQHLSDFSLFSRLLKVPLVMANSTRAPHVDAMRSTAFLQTNVARWRRAAAGPAVQ